MLQTVEAIVDPSGTVRLLEQLHVDHPCRAVVTLLEEAVQAQDAHIGIPAGTAGWRRFVGSLSGSPHFNEDPMDLQRAMRDEWD